MQAVIPALYPLRIAAGSSPGYGTLPEALTDEWLSLMENIRKVV